MRKKQVTAKKAPSRKAPKLTPKQKRFCEEWLIDRNGTQAAKRAGYSEHTAQQVASENLSKPLIREYLNALVIKQTDRTEITADYVLNTIRATVERCQTPFDYDPSNVLRGSELLGKNQKLFTDKIEHSGAIDLSGASDQDLHDIINGASR